MALDKKVEKHELFRIVSVMAITLLSASPTFDMITPSDDFSVEFDFNPVQPAWGAHPGLYLFSSPYENFDAYGSPPL